MNQKTKTTQCGFTLIEVIITLVLVAILASMVVPYFGSSLTQSGAPLARLNTSLSLNKIMENITAEYNNRFQHWRPNTAYVSNAVIIPTTTNENGYQYRASGGGTSGTTEPGWPLYNFYAPGTSHMCTTPPDSACTVTDGGVTWYLYASSPTLTTLRAYIGAAGDQTQTFNTISCTYGVIQNSFIKFDSTTHQEVDLNDTTDVTDPEYGKFLKIKIGYASNDPKRTGETISALFVIGNH